MSTTQQQEVLRNKTDMHDTPTCTSGDGKVI